MELYKRNATLLYCHAYRKERILVGVVFWASADTILYFNMQEIIYLLILNALFITGLWTACKYSDSGLRPPAPDHRMPLWFVSFYTKKLIGEYWTKPLFTCGSCMSSVWGTVFYWTYLIQHNAKIDFDTIAIWIIYILMLLGINKLIHEYLSK